MILIYVKFSTLIRGLVGAEAFQVKLAIYYMALRSPLLSIYFVI